MSYLLSHWRGKLSLKLSLWVNMVGLLCVISAAELYMLSRLAIDPAHLVRVCLLSLLVTRLIIYPWQLIGLFRAIEQDFIDNRNTLKTRGVQIFALLTVIFTLTYSLEVIQRTVFHKHQLEMYARPPAHIDYQLQVDASRQQLRISGSLDIGITRAVKEVLHTNPAISSVVLQSPGGQVYQGRGLARIFSEKQLDTYVYEECSSACATAFIGGRRRYLGKNARLGFHQYALLKNPRGYRVVIFDPLSEQKRDLALYESRGVKAEFLRKMFDQPASMIWFPDHSILLDADVIHAVITAGDSDR